MTTFLLDGAAPDPAALPGVLSDPALWSGHAVFETLRTYGRQPWRVAEHLERLRESASACAIPCPPDERLAAELVEVAAAVPGEAKLNVLLTGGGRRVVKAEPLDHARVGAPVRVATRPGVPPPWLPGHVKHTSRAAWLAAVRQAGVDEVLWFGPDGCWTEATRSNLFVVRGGQILTPPDDGRILRGVTRAALLEAGRAAGLPVREAPVQAGPCDEMWLSSTLKELAPVELLDGVPGPGGGPLGAALLSAFRGSMAGDGR